MATRMISCGKHGIVYRCDGSLSAPAGAMLNAAPEGLRDKLSRIEGPWCLKVLRTTERHAAYLRDVLPCINTAGAMPSMLGCWGISGGGAGRALAIATEWAEGPSLFELVSRTSGESGSLTFYALFGLAKTLADIEESSCRFAHGDVKPSNVIVPAAGNVAAARPVMLVDFDTVSLAANPRPFAMPATRAFSAPECKMCPPSAASDVYSLGACISYVLSSAHSARQASSPVPARQASSPTTVGPAGTPAPAGPAGTPAPARQASSPPARPATSPAKARSSIPLDADCAANASDLAARCMRPDPAGRPTAAEVAEEMRQMGWASDGFTALPEEITPPPSLCRDSRMIV